MVVDLSPSPSRAINRDEDSIGGSSSKCPIFSGGAVLSAGSHQHLRFKKGMAIASLNISHLCEAKKLRRDNSFCCLKWVKARCRLPKE